ncbi:cation/H(+) antiporter [Granulicella sp. WH15]|uniref:cation:proton antiporter domain-containing protein n=1 Tax=Granulicella sp. WH15 TaxID=2602070 RepID=UPI001367671D|nr:cation:proton antiporter [Granulicella sp. WH15]QHN05080.1 cation/H(+) antiporter [Granulicella sp. WH15]
MNCLILLLQLAVILAVTSLCGALARRVGQPKVVGEIAGGLALGSLGLGYLLPGASHFLFAASRLHLLETVSNIGLVLFLFLIGSELDLTAAQRNRGSSLAITVGSIGVPFALGAALAPVLLVRLGTPGVSRLGFVLFTGIAMSITALPVLARILEERSSVASTTAATALIVAAANDLVAWSLLAVTLALIHGGPLATTLIGLAWLALYVTVMLAVVRPILARLSGPLWLWLPLAVGFSFASAHVTELLGIHAFFGAFLAGVCVPRVAELEKMLRRILTPAIAVTLPVFFAMTGLKMQREMFSSRGLGWLAVVLAVAVAGKIGGSMLAGRASGMGWRPALEIGILLNTRGLVELIALNVGYREGVLSPLLFTLFVLMAVLTTAMTVPLLALTTTKTP